MSKVSVELLKFRRLVSFDEALHLQEQLVHRLSMSPERHGYLLALQHEPVITLGRRAHQAALNTQITIPVRKANRGGLATYHGPGQLVLYPILNLRHFQGKPSLEHYVSMLARIMQLAIESSTNIHTSFYDHTPQRVGLWLSENEKIGFIGIQVRRWIVSHGLALNVCKTALRGFEAIEACGLPESVQITTLQDKKTNIQFDSVEKDALTAFEAVFNAVLVPHTAQEHSLAT
jgi:lipoyl(octanoyl) transferase